MIIIIINVGMVWYGLTIKRLVGCLGFMAYQPS